MKPTMPITAVRIATGGPEQLLPVADIQSCIGFALLCVIVLQLSRVIILQLHTFCHC